MDSIYRGDLSPGRGRRNAWLDSLLIDHAVFRLVWANFAAVRPGQLYRANHPTPGQLARHARRHGIRSIINLRGLTANGSDALSRAAAARLGIAIVDVPFKSRRAPDRAALLTLLAALRTAARPILVHCKSGADRAGFAAGVDLLLAGGSSADALAQMTLRHGHLRRSRAGILSGIFTRYRDDAEGCLPFEAWVAQDYDPTRIRHPFGTSTTQSAIQDRLLRRE